MFWPALMLIVLLETRERTVRGDAVNSPVVNRLSWATFGVMGLSTVGLMLAS